MRLKVRRRFLTRWRTGRLDRVLKGGDRRVPYFLVGRGRRMRIHDSHEEHMKGHFFRLFHADYGADWSGSSIHLEQFPQRKICTLLRLCYPKLYSYEGTANARKPITGQRHTTPSSDSLLEKTSPGPFFGQRPWQVHKVSRRRINQRGLA